MSIVHVSKYPETKMAKDAGFKESDHPRAANGEFGSGGGGSSFKAVPSKSKGTSEQKHATHPLPDKTGSSSKYDTGEHAVSVTREADGSYYGDTGDYDFVAPNAEAMRAKLKKMGARYVGWSHKG